MLSKFPFDVTTLLFEVEDVDLRRVAGNEAKYFAIKEKLLFMLLADESISRSVVFRLRDVSAVAVLAK